MLTGVDQALHDTGEHVSCMTVYGSRNTLTSEGLLD